MLAARLHTDMNELVIEEVTVPQLRPGWALLKVQAAGLCHTDIHVMDGHQFKASRGEDYTVSRPITLGHEVAGTVVEVGENVDRKLIGTRMAAGGWAGPNTTPGMHFDGGFAEYCLLPAGKLVRVPDNVDIDCAAVATDSIKTAYAAVTRAAQVRSGENVAIIGLGGLGISALRTAVLLGAHVYGVDINLGARAKALESGAVACFATADELDKVDIVAIVDFVGGDTTSTALDMVQSGGRVALVGLGDSNLTIDSNTLVLGRKSLIGSLGSLHTSDFEAVLHELDRGNLIPDIEVIPFADINAGYDRLRKGEVRGRLVVHPSTRA